MSNFHWLGSVKHSSVLIVKVLIGTFNHKNTLTGAFSMIVKFLLRFVSSSSCNANKNASPDCPRHGEVLIARAEYLQCPHPDIAHLLLHRCEVTLYYKLVLSKTPLRTWVCPEGAGRGREGAAVEVDGTGPLAAVSGEERTKYIHSFWLSRLM